MVVVDGSIPPLDCVDLPLASDAVVAADTTEDGEGVTGSVSENNSSIMAATVNNSVLELTSGTDGSALTTYCNCSSEEEDEGTQDHVKGTCSIAVIQSLERDERNESKWHACNLLCL